MPEAAVQRTIAPVIAVGEAKEPVAIPVARTALPQPDVLLFRVDLPDVLDPRLILLHSPSSSRARAFRLLRHRLLSKEDPRVIVVSSAEPGEGKTTCAVNLALAIVEETPSTALYLDANLQRPALSKLFGLESVEGMLQGLQIRTYPVGAVSGSRLRICATVPEAAPDARLDRGTWPQAIRDFREAYDYVIVDAASVPDSADVNVLAEHADGVVIAARAGVSTRTGVQRAIEQLSPARVLGMALLDT